MNIQIFGTAKSFDTKKAQRFFKERGIKFQFVDLAKFGMSKGEFRSVRAALKCSVEDLIDPNAKAPELTLIKYLASEEAKEEKLLENQTLFKMPIVRGGKQATVGYCPDTWKTWE